MREIKINFSREFCKFCLQLNQTCKKKYAINHKNSVRNRLNQMHKQKVGRIFR